WENGDVWGSDFREGTDLAGDGGSDVPEIYFFKGHGSCESPGDFERRDEIYVCGNFGKPDATIIGRDTRWGNKGGNLQFMFVDASCPMDLDELGSSWFPAFQGLHMAVGHSGDTEHDTHDSSERASYFARMTLGLFGFPQFSVGDAWMIAGLWDIDPGVSAVAL